MKTKIETHDCELEKCNCCTTFDDCPCCQDGDCDCKNCENCADYETVPDLTQDDLKNKR